MPKNTENELGRLILKLANTIIKNRNRHLEALDLTSGQADSLQFFLTHDQATATELKEYLGITHQTARGIIQRMITKGLLELHRSDADALSGHDGFGLSGGGRNGHHGYVLGHHPAGCIQYISGIYHGKGVQCRAHRAVGGRVHRRCGAAAHFFPYRRAAGCAGHPFGGGTGLSRSVERH